MTAGLAGAVFGRLASADQAILARCAAVAVFDPAMYAARLRVAPADGADPGVDKGPELPALVRAGTVEVLPGGADRYRVLPALRDAAWASWFPDGAADGATPEPLREFAAKLESYCAAAGNPVERLRAALLLGVDRAGTAFGEEFKRCDERLDLAGCQSLIDVLDEASGRLALGSELAAEKERLRRHLAARRLHRGAYLDTARYLHRPNLEAALLGVLDSTGPRALRLHGSGGHGKSTLLRWFLSRHCVPHGIASALIDLDVLDAVNATRYPWLVVLEIAGQLNDQIDGAPFEELVSRYRNYRSLLARRAGEPTDSAAAALDTEAGAVDGQEVLSRFSLSLPDVLADEPVLVVLDTFEEAVLRPAPHAWELVETLRRIQDAVPAVRLVISGRGTAEEGQLFVDDGPASVAVPLFDAAESRAYLERVRGIDRPELVEVLVARAFGLPWQLALDADVVELYPAITPADFDGLDSGVAWAADRIVGRIEGPLQWLVRYGSVLRCVTRDLVEHVLLPRVAEAMAGSDIDRPDTDPLPPDAVPVFVRPAPPPPDVEGLWGSLQRYAATGSWAQFAGSSSAAVVFEAALREPLRRLVAAQPVGELLHEDAVRYFAEHAATEGSDWPVSVREWLYHRFRLDGVADGSIWRAAVARARAADRPDQVVELGEEIIGPDSDYLDGTGRPRETRPGTPSVAPDLLSDCYTEHAWASARIARRERLTGGHPLWSRVETSILAARRVSSGRAGSIWLVAATMALGLARNQPAPVADVPPPDSAGVGPDGLDLFLVVADTYRAAGEIDGARRILLTASELDMPPGARADVAEALARDSLSVGRLDDAARWAVVANDGSIERRRLSVRIALDSGLPATALAMADGDDLMVEQAEALTALGRPREAVRRCTEVMDVGKRWPAELLRRRGVAFGELFEVDDALDDLERAQRLYGRGSEAESAALCSADAAALHLRVVGNLREAARHLDEADRQQVAPASPAWIRCRLLRAELESGLADAADPAGHVGEALDAVLRGPAPDPRRVVEVALGGLCWAPALRPRASEVLVEHLARITPAAARLAALTALDALPAGPWGERLLSVIFPDGGTLTVEHPQDRAWLTWLLVELHLAAGRGELAARLAVEAATVLDAPSGIAWWRWMRAVSRIAPATLDVPPGAALPDGSGLMRVAGLLTWAELRLAHDPRDDDRSWLDWADRELVAVRRPTRWRLLALELRARIAGRNGDPAESDRLGEAADVLRGELGRQTDRPRTARDAARPFGRDDVELIAQLPPTEPLTVSVAAGLPLLRLPSTDPLVSALEFERGSTERYPVAGAVREALRAGSLLRLDALPSPEGRGDLRLATEPGLAQLPWELAAVGDRLITRLGFRTVYRRRVAPHSEHAWVRVLQETLAGAGLDVGPRDGQLGPRTTRAIKEMQRSAGLPAVGIVDRETWQALTSHRSTRPPGLLVLQRDLEDEIGSHRGSTRTGSAPLYLSFREIDWNVEVADDPDHARPPDFPVDVVHITASVDSARGGLYLDFGASTTPWGAGPESLGSREVNALVARLAERGRTPLVVLEVPGSPKLSSETVRQLLLRNEFADQLVTDGPTHTVLATGLGLPHQAAAFQVQLFRGLATAATAADVVTKLHLTAPFGRPEEALPWTAAALFSALPADLMPPIRP